MKYFLLLSFLLFKMSHAGTHFAPSFEGYECEGPDKTFSMDNGQWTEFSCTEGEWIFRVNGGEPFIAKLQKSKVATSDEYEFFNVVPTQPVTAKARWILRQHWMRVDGRGEIDFLNKR